MDAGGESLQSLVIQYLVAHTQCSGCGGHYSTEDVRIRARRGDVWLAAVTCGHCGLQGLIMAAIRTRETPEPGSPLQEDTAEEGVLAQREPISSDEVLDWHCFLEQFHGDVRRLLGSEGDLDDDSR